MGLQALLHALHLSVLRQRQHDDLAGVHTPGEKDRPVRRGLRFHAAVLQKGGEVLILGGDLVYVIFRIGLALQHGPGNLQGRGGLPLSLTAAVLLTAAGGQDQGQRQQSRQ